MTIPSIFISHTHTDQEVAHALRDAVQTIFGEAVIVRYSTNKELHGGIRPGEDWFRWIGQQVREAEIALILLTPSSIQKPWVLWEGGAVAGAALVGEERGARKLRPLSYKLRGAEIPTPFGRDQVSDGLSEPDVRRLFEDLLEHFSLPQDRLIKAAQRLEVACSIYLTRAHEALRMAPLLVTEAAVQEWLGRIDKLEREARFSETDELHDWMNVAFGRGGNEGERPLDLRVHRRLGELYSRSGNVERAAKEFELARQLAPRDIYVLRRLGKAYLDQHRLDAAEEIISTMRDLDAKAFVRNAENAAFKARWHREKGDMAAAKNVLTSSSEASPQSYYLGDLLGQVQLELGMISEAQATYRRVLGVIADLRERNVWIAASGLAAAMVVCDQAQQDMFLDELQRSRMSAQQAKSIRRGLNIVVELTQPAPHLRHRIAEVLEGGGEA